MLGVYLENMPFCRRKVEGRPKEGQRKIEGRSKEGQRKIEGRSKEDEAMR